MPWSRGGRPRRPQNLLYRIRYGGIDDLNGGGPLTGGKFIVTKLNKVRITTKGGDNLTTKGG